MGLHHPPCPSQSSETLLLCPGCPRRGLGVSLDWRGDDRQGTCGFSTPTSCLFLNCSELRLRVKWVRNSSCPQVSGQSGTRIPQDRAWWEQLWGPRKAGAKMEAGAQVSPAGGRGRVAGTAHGPQGASAEPALYRVLPLRAGAGWLLTVLTDLGLCPPQGSSSGKAPSEPPMVQPQEGCKLVR